MDTSDFIQGLGRAAIVIDELQKGFLACEVFSFTDLKKSETIVITSGKTNARFQIKLLPRSISDTQAEGHVISIDGHTLRKKKQVRVILLRSHAGRIHFRPVRQK